jgi:hypothetical protein
MVWVTTCMMFTGNGRFIWLRTLHQVMDKR